MRRRQFFVAHTFSTGGSLSEYVNSPGDNAVPTVEFNNQLDGIDGCLIATLVREIVRFEWSGAEDDLVCEVERLFPGGAALIHVKHLNTIQEA
jgi:hypothetical protein